MKIIVTLSHIRKTAFLHKFLSTITFQFLFHFRGWRRLLLFNGVLFTLCMDYDVALRLENVKKSKFISNITRKTSKRYIKIHSPRLLDPGPHTCLHWIKAGVEIAPALKNHIFFMNYRTRKPDIAKTIIYSSVFPQSAPS